MSRPNPPAQHTAWLEAPWSTEDEGLPSSPPHLLLALDRSSVCVCRASIDVNYFMPS